MKQDELTKHLTFLLYMQKMIADLNTFMSQETISLLESIIDKHIELYEIPQEIVDNFRHE